MINKKLFLHVIIASTLLLSGIFLHKLFSDYSIFIKSSTLKRYDQNYSIAIIQFAANPQIEEVIATYNENLQKHLPNAHIKTRTYNANGNLILLQAICQEALLSKCDLIYAIGVFTTQTLKELVTSRSYSSIPIVFCGMAKTVWDEWVQKECHDIQNYMTGIVGGYDWPKRVDLILTLKPNVSSVLIPHQPHEGPFMQMIDDLCTELQKRNIKARQVIIESFSAVGEKIKPFLPETDLLFMTRDAFLLRTAENVINLCNRYGTTIFCSDLNSIEKGAAFGLGVDETLNGKISAAYSKKILLDHKKTSDIPIFNFEDNGNILMVNEKALQAQNLPLSPELLFILKNGFVIKENGVS